jgi:hypothetical protein
MWINLDRILHSDGWQRSKMGVIAAIEGEKSVVSRREPSGSQMASFVQPSGA